MAVRQLMRIISGSARGRRLKAPDTMETRPVTDRVREAVFSSIGSWVDDADVLDLFAGSGSFGLEALSRGARSAVFVERGRKALEALRSNVESIGLGGDVVSDDVARYAARCAETFHLIFMDPPWDVSSSELEQLMAVLDDRLAPNGEVVISRRHSDPVPAHPETWRVAAEKRYGDTRIMRYEKLVTDDDGDVPGELRPTDERSH